MLIELVVVVLVLTLVAYTLNVYWVTGHKRFFHRLRGMASSK